MSHTVAVKAIPGVLMLFLLLFLRYGDAQPSLYVELEEGYDFEEVSQAIKQDPYF